MSSRTPERRSELLAQLRADQSQRWRRGERVPVEHYLTQYPELSADAGALLELVQSETLLRREGGEQPTLDEYLARFPQQADALRRSWPTLEARVTTSWSDSHGSTTVAEGIPQPLPPPLPPPGPGFVLPGLELHEKLGEGGMGVVYRARDVRLDRPRAIKVIRRGAFGGEEARGRFNREAKAVARLDHPGVVRIYQLGEHEGTLYICMEFLEGGNLQARLRQGPLEVRAAADLVRRLALAVQHAHDNRVLHRDLKPGNVLLSAAGEPKIGDFGLAKLLDTDDDLTQAGAVLGTPSYMAPEQAEGRSSEVKERTDVWALGTILYECLTGQAAFKGETRSETLEQVRHYAPEPPCRLRAEVPIELESICLKCLEKEPARRYASAGQLAADLRDWLDDRTILLERAPWPRRLLGRLRRNRLHLTLALVLLAGLCAVAYFLRRGRPEPTPESPPTAKQPPAPDVWHDLLARAPTPLRWPDRVKGKRLHYDPAARELVVSSPELGLIALGETAAPRYRIAVIFQQDPWVGNVGLFFGYRDDPVNGKPADHYQIVELLTVPGAGPGTLLRLDWKAESHDIPPETAPFERMASGKLAGSPTFVLRPGQHRLELTVGANGLEAVALDDEVKAELRAAGVPNALTPADYKGKFGVYVLKGNGTFTEARYLFHEEPQ